MKPRIGLTPTPDSLADGRLVDQVNRVYSAAVVQAGGLPYILPIMPGPDPADVPGLLAPLDGLLLTGGGDVDPGRYGAAALPEVAGVAPERDAFELALVAGAADRNLPVLGICRGLQLLNVALGGTLVQHLGTGHRVRDRYDQVVHDVRIAEDSLLVGVVGTDRLGVNSLHHQAVDVPGEGLRIVAWATDDTPEAIEGTGAWPVLAVQWHPELLTAAAAHAALFDWLITRATNPMQAVADAA